MNDRFVALVKSIFGDDREVIPLHEPFFNGNEKKYLNQCIDTTYVSSVGKFVDLFEKNIAEYTGSNHAIAAVNGTAALHIALVLSGVNSTHEVITQPLTFVATANAISYTGASPVFVDVDLETMGLSSEKLEHFLLHKTIQKFNPESQKEQPFNRLTKKFITACVPMHSFGFPAKIDEIAEICKKYHIALIEDAAESLGSSYKGVHTGTKGAFGILSFNGNKILTTGGGGMILTNNSDWAKKAKHLTTTAKVPHKWAFIHDQIGYNYRLTNLSAALGVAQLEQLPKFLEAKRKLANVYASFFKNTSIIFKNEPEHATANYWLNTILLPNKAERDAFLEFTNNRGVLTRPAWNLMTDLPMFKDAYSGNLDNAEYLADRIVNIPSSVILNQ